MYTLYETDMQPFLFSNSHEVYLYSLTRPETYCALKLNLKAGPISLPALIDTGAFTSAISLDLFKQIESQSPQSIFKKKEKPSYSECVASNDSVDVLFRAEIEFELPVGSFRENFLILPKMRDVLLGLSFCTHNNVVIDFSNKLLKLPDFTLQLNCLQINETSVQRLNNPKQIELKLNSPITLEPYQQTFVSITAELPHHLRETTGIIEPIQSVEQEFDIY